jgi:CheY-like chemotaxis protein
MTIQGQNTLELTIEEESLLNTIIDKGLKIIKPSLDLNGVKYADLEDFMNENDFEWESIRYILESLQKKEVLKPKDHIRALICSECGSPHVYSKFSCTRCQSTELSNIELIEHSVCGYTGSKDKFISGSELICPNCNTNLGQRTRMRKSERDPKTEQQTRKRRTVKNPHIEQRTMRKSARVPITEHKILGSTFECENCGHRFEKPNTTHFCQSCENSFDYKTARYDKLYSYEIIEEIIAQLKKTKEITVLVVEDNPDDADIIKVHLEKKGDTFKVDIENTGQKSLKKIEEKYYDVIILDHNLPDTTGIKILEGLRKKGIKTPVIMLTGADDRKIAVEAMKLGASDYLIKSVELYTKLPNIILEIMKK